MDMQDITDAVKDWFSSVVDYFKRFPENMRKLGEKIQRLPVDEKAAYGSITIGSVLVIVGLILW